MALRPRMALLVAVTTLAAACTTNTEATNRTTPSDVFAPTPSIGEGTTIPATTTLAVPPTTRPDVERAYVARVDPFTLEELPQYEPIAMGDWMWGMTSDNGRWLTLNIGDDDGFSTGIRLVDVEVWEVAGEWPDTSDNGVAVTDTGVVYGQRDLTIGRLLVSEMEVEPIWTTSGDHSIWGAPEVDDGRYLSYGTTLDQDGNQGPFTVFSGDETGGALVTTPLTGIRIGLAEVVDLADGRIGVIDAYPALVWDADRHRALIVHATQDVVTEFDLTTAESADHVFGPDVHDPGDPVPPSTYPDNASYWASTRRAAQLSPDGSRLYVAGAVGEFEEESTISVSTPSGVLAIDTSSWTTIAELDIPVSDIYLSPDGSRLIATGGREVSTLSSYRLESSGWYLIDTSDLSVIGHVEAERPDQWFGSTSFNSEADVAYVSSWTSSGRVDVVDLDTGEVSASREGDNIQMFGNVGVIGDVVDVVVP